MRQSFRRLRDVSSCCHRFEAARVSVPLGPPSCRALENRSIIVCRLRAHSLHRCPTTAPPLEGASPPFEAVSNRSRWTTPQVFLGRSFLPGRLGYGPPRSPRIPPF